jgi:hypothetical protein
MLHLTDDPSDSYQTISQLFGPCDSHPMKGSEDEEGASDALAGGQM